MNERREARASCSSLLSSSPFPAFVSLISSSSPLSSDRCRFVDKGGLGWNRQPSPLFETIYEISRCSHAQSILAFPRPCVDDTPKRKRCFYFYSALVSCFVFVVNGSFVERSVRKYLSDFSRSKTGTGSVCRNVALVSSNRFVSDVFFVKYRLSPPSPLGAPRLLITECTGCCRTVQVVDRIIRGSGPPFPSAKGSSRTVGEEGEGGGGEDK